MVFQSLCIVCSVAHTTNTKTDQENSSQDYHKQRYNQSDGEVKSVRNTKVNNVYAHAFASLMHLT